MINLLQDVRSASHLNKGKGGGGGSFIVKDKITE